MSKYIECPKCLGQGEIYVNKLMECDLCQGDKTIHPEIAEDYIHSLIIFEDEE